MLFQSRVFQLAKDTECPEECQDACGMDAAGGIAVVADGVASAIFSRQWADVLVRATVADAPDPTDTEAFAGWLARRRQQWAEQIDTTGLAWFQKAKLPMGAFSTLLWVRLLPVDEQQEGTFGAYRLQGFAIGDSCLFHVRGGELVRTFPIQKAEELEANPVVLGSVDLNRDQLMEFTALDELCYPGDLLVLCTDAIADWALRLAESGSPVAWDSYSDMDAPEWEDEIAELRGQSKMRYDDATLVLLRVAEPCVEVDQPQESPSTAEVEEVAEVDEAPPQVAAAESPQEAVTDEFPQLDVTELRRPKRTEEDWKEKVRSASEQVVEQIDKVSGQVASGWRKWRKKAIKKYCDKFGPDEK